MRVLITGGRGQLAADLVATYREAGAELLTPAREELDIRDAAAIEDVFSSFHPDLVVNTAAFHKVDLCETEPEQSFGVNAVGVRRLAEACARHHSFLVHYSTDYVFDGSAETPYPEDHPVSPLNLYGVSKVAGECVLRCTLERHLIIRTTGLYGWAGATTGRGNFPETMIRAGRTREVVTVVADQVLTPTFTPDLAEICRELVAREITGTVHVTSGGQCSWYEFASEIFRLLALPARLEPISQDAWPVPARRPAYSVLAHDVLQRHGIPEPRPWQEALAVYLAGRPHAAPEAAAPPAGTA